MTSSDGPALIQYVCERCQTRFVLPPSRRRLGLGGRFHATFMAFGRMFRHRQGLGRGYDESRRELLQKMDDDAYQAFVQSFRFCHECRKFVCNDCWSTARRACLTCVAKSMTETVATRPPFMTPSPEVPRPAPAPAPRPFVPPVPVVPPARAPIPISAAPAYVPPAPIVPPAPVVPPVIAAVPVPSPVAPPVPEPLVAATEEEPEPAETLLVVPIAEPEPVAAPEPMALPEPVPPPVPEPVIAAAPEPEPVAPPVSQPAMAAATAPELIQVSPDLPVIAASAAPSADGLTPELESALAAMAVPVARPDRVPVAVPAAHEPTEEEVAAVMAAASRRPVPPVPMDAARAAGRRRRGRVMRDLGFLATAAALVLVALLVGTLYANSNNPGGTPPVVYVTQSPAPTMVVVGSIPTPGPTIATTVSPLPSPSASASPTAVPTPSPTLPPGVTPAPTPYHTPYHTTPPTPTPAPTASPSPTPPPTPAPTTPPTPVVNCGPSGADLSCSVTNTGAYVGTVTYHWQVDLSGWSLGGSSIVVTDNTVDHTVSAYVTIAGVDSNPGTFSYFHP